GQRALDVALVVRVAVAHAQDVAVHQHRRQVRREAAGALGDPAALLGRLDLVAPHRGRHAEQADPEGEATPFGRLGHRARHRPLAAFVLVDAAEFRADGGTGRVAQPGAPLGLFGPLRDAGHVGHDAVDQLRGRGDVDRTLRGRLCHGISFVRWFLTLVAGSQAWPSSITRSPISSPLPPGSPRPFATARCPTKSANVSRTTSSPRSVSPWSACIRGCTPSSNCASSGTAGSTGGPGGRTAHPPPCCWLIRTSSRSTTNPAGRTRRSTASSPTGTCGVAGRSTTSRACWPRWKRSKLPWRTAGDLGARCIWPSAMTRRSAVSTARPRWRSCSPPRA